MQSAVIIDTVRTPIARRRGKLADWHPTDLAAVVLRALFERNDIDPAMVDDVVMGCVSQVGEQSTNVARNSWLSAGLPESVPATTVDRQCGSSMQATHFAAQGVLAGAYDVVVACGVESMTRVPMGANVPEGGGIPFGKGLFARYWGEGRTGLTGQGPAAELVAEKWDVLREELDDLAYESHLRALRSQKEGRFEREIVPVVAEDGSLVLGADDGPRPDIDRDAMAKLPPVFRPDGRITAGNSSQVSDGAAAMLIMSEERASQLGLRPRARFHSFAVAGDDPVAMFTAPIPATRKVLDRVGMTIDEIDLFEMNEAFAVVPIVWAREVGADRAKVNVNGGACALGHPLGATGVRMATTLLNELERSGGRWGLQAICEGGGLSNATIIERLD